MSDTLNNPATFSKRWITVRRFGIDVRIETIVEDEADVSSIAGAVSIVRGEDDVNMRADAAAVVSRSIAGAARAASSGLSGAASATDSLTRNALISRALKAKRAIDAAKRHGLRK